MSLFQGERSFPLPPDQVFAKLADASFLVSCLKDVVAVLEAGPDKAVWTVRPGFSFIRTTLESTMEMLERVSPTSIKVKLFSKGIGATSTVVSTITLQPKDDGTAVHWSAGITELTGLLKLVPRGVISSTANKVIEDTWVEIEKKLR